MPAERRRRAYLAMMGACLVLAVAAWTVVRLWSVPLAVAMSLVAAVIPPAAAIVGNAGTLTGREPLDFEERRSPGPAAGRGPADR